MSIFISSTPTIEEDDLRLSRNLLKAKEIEDIKITLPGFSAQKHFFTNTGRASLYLILQSLGIKKDDEVIVQSFTCMALIVPLLWLEIEPVYADIDPNTYNISLDSIKKNLTEKTRSVIVQHTFGIPADILAIKTYIDSLNMERSEDERVYLIEDCAHCLNNRREDQYLGTFGDASFFSFGQDKVVSTTQGGCAIANDKGIEDKLEKIYENIPEMTEKIVKYNLRYSLLWNIIKKAYYTPEFLASSKRLSKFTVGKFLILLFRLLGLIKQQASKEDFGNPNEDVSRLSFQQKHLLKNQLEKIDRFTQHREEVINKYSRLLELELGGSLIRYPVLVRDPSEVKSRLQEIRVIAGNWYNSPVIPRGIDLDKIKYEIGSCPNAEYLMEHIINLPTGVNVNDKDVEKIINIMKPYLL
ncbi:DegT/DnrJ/EryC1/StrS family aminotransferase [Candidatus Dojkabacteria bacterium]|jgi:dTDP-4-amino-4,6-dideoxygalactose transaminase|nr:DegT/DnrJ/EryC1/StrS family aminotransferase [Candidatus Dojkabacteria bacterium]